MIYDVIVLGLGGMGSAIAARLSKEGRAVLGLEQFGPVHDRGSSHGESRVIRKAYFEDPRYVPLVLRAYELWGDLVQKTGCVIMAPETSPVMQGCLKSAKQFGLHHTKLSGSEIEDRFGLKATSGGFYEPDGGWLPVETCVAHFINEARANGADLRFNTHASFKETPDGVEVGEFRAKTLVLATGAWAPNVQAKRAVQFWFKADQGENLPVYFQDGPRWIYGFPKIGDTIKVAFHGTKEACDPNTINRDVSQHEIDEITERAEELLPHIKGFARAKTCLYEMTPDEHFNIGEKGRVITATGFSGHGFKFAPVIAEIVEKILRREAQDLSLFKPDRFT